jgi:murein DD-endopeptidase MepM/ murein hydrolase activator NlpD
MAESGPGVLMTVKRRAFVALVLVALVVLSGIASAESVSSARRRQADAPQRGARAAARNAGARASDRQLENAVRALDAHIVGQQAETDAARQAASVAERELADLTAKLEATQKRRDGLRDQVRERAVAAYMNPSGGAITRVLSAKDLTEAARKRELLDEVMSGNGEVLDRLKATEEDLGIAQQAQKVVAARVAQRRRTAEARLVALRKARSEQTRLRGALQARIDEWIAEADAAAKQEATLSAFIRANSVPQRASRGADDPGTDGRVSGAGLIWPVRGPVTSGYGSRWGRMHEGIDIGAGSGTPIRAAKAGTVVFAGVMNGYGNVIIVDHGGGFSTLYAHQSRLGASRGQDVSQGQVIGYVGSTGHSTGPHLHFETRVNGSPRNPRNYLP